MTYYDEKNVIIYAIIRSIIAYSYNL
jgi:hypothetical protein